MLIGEFAEACGTKISVLRHYDKEGVLVPDYIDNFTGYRYYSENQIGIYNKVTALKKAKFSLCEIKAILEADNRDTVLNLISFKKKELEEASKSLEQVKNMLLEAQNNSQDTNKNFEVLKENIDISFENDDNVIGKWKVLGEYATKEDFFTKGFNYTYYGNVNKEIYFLPYGEPYWCFWWTKGYLIFDNGNDKYVNSYEVEEHNGEKYMFVQNKSYDYRRNGKLTILVLRQLDNKKYTRLGIARKDNINMPFVEDEDVLGKWKSICYCKSKEELDIEKISYEDNLYFESIEFKENGKCTSIYKDNIIDSEDMQVWTKGYVLRKHCSTACKYELFYENEEKYLIMEWKSGDYIWGGFDTDYYVFLFEDM